MSVSEMNRFLSSSCSSSYFSISFSLADILNSLHILPSSDVTAVAFDVSPPRLLIASAL